jgi:hypothetical protein
MNTLDNLPSVYTDPEESTPALYDPKVMTEAFKMYLNTTMTPHDIAIQLGVPIKALRGWIRKGDWVGRKKQEVEKLLEAELIQYREFLAANRLPTAKRHLELSSKLESAIDNLVDRSLNRDPDSNELMDSIKELKDLAGLYRTLTEAFGAASAVGARAVGLSDRPPERDEEINGKAPLVVLNFVPPERPLELVDRVVVTDVEEEKQ